MDIETPTHSTVTSFQQQAAMVRYLGELLGVGIKYVKHQAVVKMPDGTVHRFDQYGRKS